MSRGRGGGSSGAERGGDAHGAWASTGRVLRCSKAWRTSLSHCSLPRAHIARWTDSKLTLLVGTSMANRPLSWLRMIGDVSR